MPANTNRAFARLALTLSLSIWSLPAADALAEASKLPSKDSIFKACEAFREKLDATLVIDEQFSTISREAAEGLQAVINFIVMGKSADERLAHCRALRPIFG